MGKRILVITTSLNTGGITSFLIPLVNQLCKLGHAVTLAYTVDNGHYLDDIKPQVQRLQFSMPGKKTQLWQMICKGRLIDVLRIKFRRHTQISPIGAIQRIDHALGQSNHSLQGHYDVAISTAEFYCNALVGYAVDADRKIGWVHPDLGVLPIDLKFSRALLVHLDQVATVSETGFASLQRMFPEYADKFCYIENMLDVEKIQRMAQEAAPEMAGEVGLLRFVTVCRIDNSSKRLDRVVKVGKLLKERGVPYCWYIVGDGADAQALKALIDAQGLTERILMLGKRRNPYPYIKAADAFVLTSQYEGKPIVIEEAKLLHTPVITTAYSAAQGQVPAMCGVVVTNTDGVLEIQMADILADTVRLRALREDDTYVYSCDAEVKKISRLMEE